MKIAPATLLFFALPLIFSPDLRASLDPLIGTRVAMATTETMLTQVYLPSMSEDKSEIAPQLSYIIAKTSGDINGVGARYNGNFSGFAVGVGYSSTARSRLGYYGTLVVANTTGSVVGGPFGGGPGFTMTDFNNTGYTGAFGLSLRLIGKKESRFAVGAFAAPAVLNFDSSFHIGSITYGSSALAYGYLAGAQVRILLGDFLIHPYYVIFNDLSNQCRKMTVTGGNMNSIVCDGIQSSLPLKGSFNAYGLILAYGYFRANVYTETQSEISGDPVTVSNYQVSYAFTF